MEPRPRMPTIGCQAVYVSGRRTRRVRGQVCWRSWQGQRRFPMQRPCGTRDRYKISSARFSNQVHYSITASIRYGVHSQKVAVHGLSCAVITPFLPLQSSVVLLVLVFLFFLVSLRSSNCLNNMKN